jgi:hypothetical protein
VAISDLAETTRLGRSRADVLAERAAADADRATVAAAKRSRLLGTVDLAGNPVGGPSASSSLVGNVLTLGKKAASAALREAPEADAVVKKAASDWKPVTGTILPKGHTLDEMSNQMLTGGHTISEIAAKLPGGKHLTEAVGGVAASTSEDKVKRIIVANAMLAEQDKARLTVALSPFREKEIPFTRIAGNRVKVTDWRGDDTVVHFGDMLANPSMFKLNDAQKAFVSDYHKVLDEAVDDALKRGAKFDDLGVEMRMGE